MPVNASKLTSAAGKPLCMLAAFVITCSSVSSAETMTTRSLLDLNQFGKKISGISWCNDNTFTAVHDKLAVNQPTEPQQKLSRQSAVSLFHLDTQTVSLLFTYRTADVAAYCVRNGEYIYASGRVGVMEPERVGLLEPKAETLPFAQFVEVGSYKRVRPFPLTFWLTQGDGLSEPLLTASDGSIYGQTSGAGIDLGKIERSNRPLITRQNDLTYRVQRYEAEVSVFATSPQRTPPRPFPIYGLNVPEGHALGSYDCPSGHPGCAPPSQSSGVVYYVYSPINAGKKREHILFTVVPGREPTIQRWPVVSKPGLATEALLVRSVALDSGHCYVLLEPKSWLATNRVNGRLKLDLYLSNCEFTNNHLEFGEPRIVGQKQASFIVPKLDMRGEYVVITETSDLSAAEDDQQEAELAAKIRPNVCVRIFHSAPVAMIAATNVICVKRAGDAANSISVSPAASYVSVESDNTPLIVGREYHNDGTGPAWLNHGERK